MKRTNYFFHMLIAVGLCGLMYCADDGASKDDGVSKDAQGYDSTTAHDQQSSDSASAVHHVDPANAYPQPPVTGSNQDSSRTKDSGKRRDTPNRPGY
ncbi:hypothetical protein [Longitalea luteola]|uniref:hypothetical protein n=1 Tax=Longitalea luteola TaxID=2812563 RepID=UPI001A97B304|nr:hypothetical protein [Longitalea luteola]